MYWRLKARRQVLSHVCLDNKTMMMNGSNNNAWYTCVSQYTRVKIRERISLELINVGQYFYCVNVFITWLISFRWSLFCLMNSIIDIHVLLMIISSVVGLYKHSDLEQFWIIFGWIIVYHRSKHAYTHTLLLHSSTSNTYI